MNSKTIHNPWLIFSISCSLFFLSQFYRVSNAVIAPELIRDLAVDTKGLGLISAAFFYAFALTQIPISLLLDKIGPRRMVTTLSAIGILGTVVFSWADSMALGVTGRVLMGVGMACNLMGTYKVLTLWFSPRAFGTLAGLVVALGTAGNMVATTPLVVLVSNLGWRSSFQLIAAVNLMLVLLFFVIVRDHPAQNDSGKPATSMNMQGAFGNLQLLLAQKDFWIIGMATFVRYGFFASFQALWAGPYLMEVMGYPALTAGNLILLMNVGMILGAPCCGVVSDRLFNTRKWVIVGGLITIVSAMVILASMPPVALPATLALLFFCLGFANATGPLMYPHIKELVPADMSGAAMTGINFFTMIGPAVFLQGLGILMQTLYPDASRGPEAFDAAFTVCIVSLTIVVVSYVYTKERGRVGGHFKADDQQ